MAMEYPPQLLKLLVEAYTMGAAEDLAIDREWSGACCDQE